MAYTSIMKIEGSIPCKYVSKQKQNTRTLPFGYHTSTSLMLNPGDPDFKMEDFMLFSEPKESLSEDEDSNDFLELGVLPQHLPSGSGNRKSFNKKYSPVSYNFVDYVLKREHGLNKLERQSVNIEYGTRHMLSMGMFKEHHLDLSRINKVFCSQWVEDNRIVMGTRCNKLLVYDVNKRKLETLPSLVNSEGQRSLDYQCGIHAVEINPTRTLLATGGNNSRDLAIYKLPSLQPVCVGESGHKEWILGICWLDADFVVSGATDGKLALWKIPEEMVCHNDGEYSPIEPMEVRKCYGADRIRSLMYNKRLGEIVALSMNSYLHIWDSSRYYQKMSKKLANAMDNACLTQREDGTLYAIGSKSHLTLIDPRTLHTVRKITTRVSGCSIRSLTFNKNILTIGTGVGIIMIYDIRAGKYMESSMNSGRAVVLKTTNGWLNPDDAYHDVIRNLEHTPAIYTHCYDFTGTRLFAGGGPLDAQLKGNYAALWC